MLSFTNGLPIAIIEGGRSKGKTLKFDENVQPFEDDDDNTSEYGEMSEFQRRRMHKAMKTEEKGKQINLLDGEFVPLPRVNKNRTVWYLSAPSDGGKSILGEKIAIQYKKIYPKNKIYIFSTHDDDFMNLTTAKFVKMDGELCEKGLKCDMLANSLCIFDDIDTLGKINVNETVEKIVKGEVKQITKKKKVDLSDNIRQIRDDLLQNGRHNNISMICMTHLLNNFKQTRLLLSEADYIIYYNSTPWNHVKRYLELNKGYEKAVIKHVKNLRSRWTLICNKKMSITNPVDYVLTENSAYII